MSALATFLFPELRALPASARAGALRLALAEPFEVVELLALAVALLGTSVSATAGALVGALVLLRRTRRSLAGYGA